MLWWWNVLVPLGFGLASIIGNRGGAQDLLRRLAKVQRGPLDPPLSAAEDEALRRKYRFYRVMYVVAGIGSILIGIKNLLGL